MPDFLLEIGCEEIPARMIAAASDELGRRVSELLDRERLAAHGAVTSFDTPRRLAILAPGIAAAQADVTEQVTGPSVSVAYKDGQPTPAAQAFAKKAGVEVSQLEKISTAKGEYLAAQITKKGRSAGEILAELLPREINAVYWPKSMYWRKANERFIRPVRWVVAMLDGEVIPFEFDGVAAGSESRGHRILANVSVPVSAGEAYVATLAKAKVLGRSEREHQIRKALDAATRTVSGARWREDKSLLDTVVNLTEFPSVILGTFDREFLDLPEEVLVTVMRDHQKYFAVEDANGKLAPHFLAVLNTDGDPEGTIRHGHERVLRARFNDARFFWQTDQKQTLRDRTQGLKHVTFQKDLGSYYEKTLRVQRLGSWLAEVIRQGGIPLRPGVIHKATCLAKADLTTELVKEFTELQGIVGGLYARAQKLDPDLPDGTRLAIADAIYDHYKPESTEDSVPRTIEGAVLSIADKADTIAGMFALGLIPSGSKDPFALRRQANGIVKTIAEYKLPIDLGDLAKYARAAYRGSDAEIKFKNADYENSVRSFFRERLEFYLRDVRGYPYDVVNAVLAQGSLAQGSDDVVGILARAHAVNEARSSDDFRSICVAFKRVKNILRQAQEKQIAFQPRADRAIMTPPEQALYDEVTQKSVDFNRHAEKGEYGEALSVLAKIRRALDDFFEKVMVMVDDPAQRANRLGLLSLLDTEFRRIADFSEIVTEGNKESLK